MNKVRSTPSPGWFGLIAAANVTTDIGFMLPGSSGFIFVDPGRVQAGRPHLLLRGEESIFLIEIATANPGCQYRFVTISVIVEITFHDEINMLSDDGFRDVACDMNAGKPTHTWG